MYVPMHLAFYIKNVMAYIIISGKEVVLGEG